MIALEKEVDLLPFNTFGMAARARRFCRVASPVQLARLLEPGGLAHEKTLILGGGSNVLLRPYFDGLAIKNDIAGIEVERETADHVWLRAYSGAVWDHLVEYAVQRGWGGLENLSAIPGSVGGAPMQNIGAYGVEARDVIESVEAIELRSGKTRIFPAEACAFGYRESVFKRSLSGQFFILSVAFRLTRRAHRFHIGYGAIAETLQQQGQALSLRVVRQAVSRIRAAKLPNPARLGNAGSFFKNPTLSADRYEQLRSRHAAAPGYAAEGGVKTSAAWLIEQCGWKGQRMGPAGVSAAQALVLVNCGGATSEDILRLAGRIQESVFQTFQIELEPEVTLI